ncbi:MAG TPA: hypothetical protein VFW33_04510 [Gemmataceae bacterium]|nr:hypothetical protein [Gemmataceae bacterium]
MVGAEVLESLRRQPGLKRLPVVVLTSSKESADVNRAYDLGADSYLARGVPCAPPLARVKRPGAYRVGRTEKPETSEPA